jgi:hypothetical protein
MQAPSDEIPEWQVMSRRIHLDAEALVSGPVARGTAFQLGFRDGTCRVRSCDLLSQDVIAV